MSYANNFGLGETQLEETVGVGFGVNSYYRKGTPFLWLAREADFGFGLSFDPGRDARNALAAALAAQGYNVRVVYGQRGGPLEVSGTQNIDRSKGFHVRDQITGAAQQAGFYLKGILFNIEVPESNWRVGSPGSRTIWGDQTPVTPTSIFNELGADLAGDTSFVGGSIKNLAIYAGIGLLAFMVIAKTIK